MSTPNAKSLPRDSYPRYEFQASCILTLSDGRHLDGQAKNISLGGVFLQFNDSDSECAPAQQGQLEINANVQDVSFRLIIPCQTVHRSPGGIGIQFSTMDAATSYSLTQLIDMISHYNAFYSQTVNRLVKSKYNFTAFFYDILDYPWERQYRKWRPALLHDIRGKVLEMGVGTGRNLRYYNSAVQVTGIDISEQMLHRAEQRGKTARCSVELFKEDATTMTSIPSSNYDWLVSFFLCCVMPDRLQPLAIQQIERVLKPGGKFCLLEMVYSENDKQRRRQEFLAPLVEKVYGARFDRNTLEYLQQSQLLEVTSARFIKDDTYLIIEGHRKL